MTRALCQCAAITASLLLASCATTNSDAFQKEVEQLGKSTTRKKLYAVFPPLEKPAPYPLFSSSSGTRGVESYPISNQLEITYAVLYARGYDLNDVDMIINNPKDEKLIKQSLQDGVSNFEIRELK